MGAEFLVAVLWGVVVLYWLWSKRPALGDSVGMFRQELHALEFATPTRVAPANRRRPLVASFAMAAQADSATFRRPRPVVGPSGPVLGAPMASTPASLPPAVALPIGHTKRLEVRRRRRDVISVLLVLVLVSLVAAAVTRSGTALAVQIICDLALAAYAYLLVTRTKAAASRPRPATMRAARAPAEALEPALAMAPGSWQAYDPRPAADRRPAYEPVAYEPAAYEPRPVDGDYESEPSYRPAHAARTASRAPSRRFPLPMVARHPLLAPEPGAAAYGDFDSYASLALAEAN